MTKKLFPFIAALLLAIVARADPVDASRKVNWAPNVTGGVGVPGGIPNRTDIVDLTASPYNLDKTGVSDCTSAFNSAVTAATTGKVLFFPAGQYRFNSATNWINKQITIRGAGTGFASELLTTLDFRGSSSSLFNLGTGDWNAGTAVAISGTMVRGTTTTLSVSSSAGFTIGSTALITMENDFTAANGGVVVVQVGPSPRARVREQLVKITAIPNGTSVTIDQPLAFDLFSGLSPTIQPGTSVATGIGVEDLVIDATNASTTYTIQAWQIKDSWIKNVKSKMATGYHIFLDYAYNCEIRRCWVDDSKTKTANGSGIILYHSWANLIEDNVITKTFPGIEVNKGSGGNVFAYNFVNESYSGSPGSYILGASIDANHDAHNSYDLYEGNVAAMFQADGYFGSGSQFVVFRNWFFGTSTATTDRWICMALDRFTRLTSVVGNIFGYTGHTWTMKMTGTPSFSVKHETRFGYPNMGNNGYTGTQTGGSWSDMASMIAGTYTSGPGGFQELDLDAESTTTLKGNYYFSQGGIPAAQAMGGDTYPNSYFQPSKPSWWGSMTWPGIDAAAGPAGNLQVIPAAYRYFNNAEQPTGGDTTAPTPNPSTIASATATGTTTATVVATTATDAGSPPVEYRFSKDGGSSWSAWQSSATYNWTGLTAATLYPMQVQARDSATSPNSTTASSSSNVTTNSSSTLTIGTAAKLRTAF